MQKGNRVGTWKQSANERKDWPFGIEDSSLAIATQEQNPGMFSLK